MNQRSIALLLLLVVVLGFGAFVLYDFKNSNHLGLRSDQPKNNFPWEDNWDQPTVDPKEQPKEQPKQPERPKEQVLASSYAEAIKKAAELKMQVFVFFEADWCSWCKKMKQDTFSNAKVKEALMKYVVVYVNVDKDKSVGKKFGVRFLPSYAITNDKEEKLKVEGGFKTADEFLQWLGEPAKPDQSPEKIRPRPDDKGDKGDKGSPPDRRRFRRPQNCSDVNLD